LGDRRAPAESGLIEVPKRLPEAAEQYRLLLRIRAPAAHPALPPVEIGNDDAAQMLNLRKEPEREPNERISSCGRRYRIELFAHPHPSGVEKALAIFEMSKHRS